MTTATVTPTEPPTLPLDPATLPGQAHTFLSANPPLATSFLQATQSLYALSKASEPFPGKLSHFSTLLTDGFDAEQIWEQLEAQNGPVQVYLTEQVDEFVAKGDVGTESEEEDEFAAQRMEIELSGDDESEDLSDIHELEAHDDDDLDVDEEEDEEVIRTTGKGKGKTAAKINMQIDENEEDGWSSDLGEENPLDRPGQPSKHNKRKKRSVIDDDFFSLEEMEKFADMGEARDMKRARKKVDEDDEDSEDEFLEDLEDDDEDNDNANEITYEDFFGPRDMHDMAPEHQRDFRAPAPRMNEEREALLKPSKDTTPKQSHPTPTTPAAVATTISTTDAATPTTPASRRVRFSKTNDIHSFENTPEEKAYRKIDMNGWASRLGDDDEGWEDFDGEVDLESVEELTPEKLAELGIEISSGDEETGDEEEDSEDGEDDDDVLGDGSLLGEMGESDEDEDDEEEDEDEKAEDEEGLDGEDNSMELSEPSNSTSAPTRKSLLGDDDDSTPPEQLSTFERQQLKLQKEIEALEDEALAPKPWTVMGEAAAKARPLNSLLEEDLEFENAAKPVPVITEEKTNDLEEMIRQRIKDKLFDDVVRKAPIKDRDFDPNRRIELDDQKSKIGLGELYEKDFAAKTSGTPVSTEKDEALAAQHAEIESLFKTLCQNLDTLSNWHFTPKPSVDDVEVKSLPNIPALQLEEVAPSHVASSNLVAPSDLFNPATKAVKGETEVTAGQKKRLRDKSRKKAGADRKQKEEFFKAIDAAKPRTAGEARKQKDRALDTLLKQSNVTVLADGKNKKTLEKGGGKAGRKAHVIQKGGKVQQDAADHKAEFLRL
ncbi:Mpp10 protein-domain-containing protein [Phlyctochytrium arcticum]|nr:Mpp10 protein-domain-containing protein [Phlyctochytrium arcticum]